MSCRVAGGSAGGGGGTPYGADRRREWGGGVYGGRANSEGIRADEGAGLAREEDGPYAGSFVIACKTFV